MTETVIRLRELRTQVRRYLHTGDDTSAVRVYRSQPERVEVQIRAAKAYATASLDKREAREYAEAILAAVAEIE